MRSAAEPEEARDSAPRSRAFEREAPDYPAGLRDLPDAPARVWVAGEVPASPAVAIVGSRDATAYGITFARQLAADLVRLGVPVVSGLARGIDAAAHLGALDAGGVTVAVLPSGLDTITPASHRELARRIAARGALLTEIESGGPRFRGQFVERNRLIAALGRVTIVVEAADRSGALSTAAAAVRLGRTVLAVPGDVGRLTSRGCHALIRAGARVCEGAGDVLSALASSAGEPVPVTATRAPRSHRERAMPRPGIPVMPSGAERPAVLEASSDEARVMAALPAEPATLDALVVSSGLDAGRVLAALVRLDWAGLAIAHPGQRWARNG